MAETLEILDEVAVTEPPAYAGIVGIVTEIHSTMGRVFLVVQGHGRPHAKIYNLEPHHVRKLTVAESLSLRAFEPVRIKTKQENAQAAANITVAT